MKTKYLITGGGTGGHLAVAKALLELSSDSIFVGSSSGQDKNWFHNSDHKCYFLPSKGFVGLKFFSKVYALICLAISVLCAIFIILKERPKAVICVGGYSSLPAGLAAVVLRLPLFLHEQNSRMGLANKLLGKFAKKIFCSFTDCEKISDQAYLKLLEDSGLIDLFSPEASVKNTQTFSASFAPYPLQKSLLNNYSLRNQTKTILILGGSLGASALNELALKLAPNLSEFRLIHQCGKANLSAVASAYQQANIEFCSNLSEFLQQPDSTARICLIDFCQNMKELYSACDFAISRAGASALNEILSFGLPALFVPYAYAASNHQFYNALWASQQGFALLCEQDNLSLELINKIINCPILPAISANLKNFKSADASYILKSCDDILA